AICQEALEMAILHEELEIQALKDTDLIERLQAEKKILLKKVRQEGLELGIRSSSKLSYQDFRHFERVMPMAEALDEEVLDYLWTFLDRKQYPEQARLQDRDFAYLLKVDPQSRVAFAQGWLEGVLTIWENLKAHVEKSQ
ncbi:MAG: hypothetical protein AAGA60_08335, partial [Cyanobacteria bacterium P01_E01_bin.42]